MSKSKKKETKKSEPKKVTHEDIAKLAYMLWERSLRPSGSDIYFWQVAEAWLLHNSNPEKRSLAQVIANLPDHLWNNEGYCDLTMRKFYEGRAMAVTAHLFLGNEEMVQLLAKLKSLLEQTAQKLRNASDRHLNESLEKNKHLIGADPQSVFYGEDTHLLTCRGGTIECDQMLDRLKMAGITTVREVEALNVSN